MELSHVVTNLSHVVEVQNGDNYPKSRSGRHSINPKMLPDLRVIGFVGCSLGMLRRYRIVSGPTIAQLRAFLILVTTFS